MKRRRFFRGVMVVVWVVCAGAWFLSYFRTVGIRMGRNDAISADIVDVALLWGHVYVLSLHDEGRPMAYVYRFNPYIKPAQGPATFPMASVWGWDYGDDDFESAGLIVRQSCGGVPMWFVMLVATGGLWWAWRRGTATDEKGGFPVEAGGERNSESRVQNSE